MAFSEQNYKHFKSIISKKPIDTTSLNNLFINEFSNPEDKFTLVEAFYQDKTAPLISPENFFKILVENERIRLNLDKIKDNYGNGLAHLAAKYGDIVGFAILKNNRIDLTAKNKDGNNFLHVAVKNQKDKFIYNLKTILEYSGPYNDKVLKAKNNQGLLPINIAINENFKSTLEKLIIFSKGTSIFPDEGYTNNQGFTPFEEVIKENKTDLLELFFKEKPYRSIQESAYFKKGNPKTAKTYLHTAAAYSNKEIIGKLISKGLKINAWDVDGNSPLHEAVKHGNIEAIKFLIEKGADINLQNSQGKTPLQLLNENQKISKEDKAAIYNAIKDISLIKDPKVQDPKVGEIIDFTVKKIALASKLTAAAKSNATAPASKLTIDPTAKNFKTDVVNALIETKPNPCLREPEKLEKWQCLQAALDVGIKFDGPTLINIYAQLQTLKTHPFYKKDSKSLDFKAIEDKIDEVYQQDTPIQRQKDNPVPKFDDRSALFEFIENKQYKTVARFTEGSLKKSEVVTDKQFTDRLKEIATPSMHYKIAKMGEELERRHNMSGPKKTLNDFFNSAARFLGNIRKLNFQNKDLNKLKVELNSISTVSKVGQNHRL